MQSEEPRQAGLTGMEEVSLYPGNTEQAENYSISLDLAYRDRQREYYTNSQLAMDQVQAFSFRGSLVVW